MMIVVTTPPVGTGACAAKVWQQACAWTCKKIQKTTARLGSKRKKHECTTKQRNDYLLYHDGSPCFVVIVFLQEDAVLLVFYLTSGSACQVFVNFLSILKNKAMQEPCRYYCWHQQFGTP
jgi:hypothetical protein